MPSRLLLIENSDKFRGTLKRILGNELPELAVYEHDPQQDGLPTRNFNWRTYDLVILDYKFSKKHNLRWLRELKEQPDFPALVMLIGSKPTATAEAKLMGADECVNKRNLTRSLLVSTVQFALKLAESKRRQHEKTMRDSTGPEVPGYTVVNKLADGGMSSIYLAKRDKSKEQVVIKTLYSESIDDESFVDRFLKEYELISRLNDPNIVKIYEQSYTESFMYMIMEYFPSGDLHGRIASRKGLSLPKALRYLVQIATGLNSIHSCGIVHRDLKPSNIMFRADESLAIIDFGISKELAMADDITIENIVMGTVGYMSPECGQGKKIDARSDIYSLGIMFYEMLMGKKPYTGKDPADVVLKHAKAPHPVLPEKYKAVQGLFEIMTAKDPRNRFQSSRRLVEFVEYRYMDILSAEP